MAVILDGISGNFGAESLAISAQARYLTTDGLCCHLSLCVWRGLAIGVPVTVNVIFSLILG